MSTTGKIAARLRAESVGRLLELARLYRDDTQALPLIHSEIKRRRKLAAQTKYRQFLLNKR